MWPCLFSGSNSSHKEKSVPGRSVVRQRKQNLQFESCRLSWGWRAAEWLFHCCSPPITAARSAANQQRLASEWTNQKAGTSLHKFTNPWASWFAWFYCLYKLSHTELLKCISNYTGALLLCLLCNSCTLCLFVEVRKQNYSSVPGLIWPMAGVQWEESSLNVAIIKICNYDLFLSHHFVVKCDQSECCIKYNYNNLAEDI